MHTVEVIEVKELSDEQVAYRIRCCGEEATDSWHTASVMAVDHEISLEMAKKRVRDTHIAKVQWRQKQGKVNG